MSIRKSIMKRVLYRVKIPFILLWILIFCCGWDLSLATEKKEPDPETDTEILDVEKITEFMFSELRDEPEKTIYVDMRNTSGKDIDLSPFLLAELERKGYNIRKSPKDACYILQVHIFFVGKVDPSNLKEAIKPKVELFALREKIKPKIDDDKKSEGGTEAKGMGEAVGETVDKADEIKDKVKTGEPYGAKLGKLLDDFGKRLHISAGKKDVTFAIVINIIISESSKESGTKKKYQTPIISTATRAKLTFEEAKTHLIQALSKSIAGIF